MMSTDSLRPNETSNCNSRCVFFSFTMKSRRQRRFPVGDLREFVQFLARRRTRSLGRSTMGRINSALERGGERKGNSRCTTLRRSRRQAKVKLFLLCTSRVNGSRRGSPRHGDNGFPGVDDPPCLCLSWEKSQIPPRWTFIIITRWDNRDDGEFLKLHVRGKSTVLNWLLSSYVLLYQCGQKFKSHLLWCVARGKLWSFLFRTFISSFVSNSALL